MFHASVDWAGTLSAPIRLMSVGTMLALRKMSKDPKDPTEPRRSELDRITLERAKRGDKNAFGELVRFYQRPVFALLSRMLLASAQRNLIEDLAQETFVRAYRAIATFGEDGRDNLTGWLLTIATRVALDALRKSNLRGESRDIAFDRIAGPDRADETLDRRTLATAIEKAVERLPVEYRAAFLLREVHELDYEAIAEALNIDLGTVKSRLSRARAALRLALAEVYP